MTLAMLALLSHTELSYHVAVLCYVRVCACPQRMLRFKPTSSRMTQLHHSNICYNLPGLLGM